MASHLLSIPAISILILPSQLHLSLTGDIFLSHFPPNILYALLISLWVLLSHTQPIQLTQLYYKKVNLMIGIPLCYLTNKLVVLMVIMYQFIIMKNVNQEFSSTRPS
jgi:hypothetical protein